MIGMDRNAASGSPAPAHAMGRSVRQLGSDVVALMELQAELFQVDASEWARSFIRPIAAIVVAAIVLLATAPVALISLGYLLAAATELPLWGAMMTAAGIGLGLAAAAAGIGIWLLKRNRPALHRFRTELKKNVCWLKETLRSSPTGVTE
jgi:uncharacterized membrane protein YqjE